MEKSRRKTQSRENGIHWPMVQESGDEEGCRESSMRCTGSKGQGKKCRRWEVKAKKQIIIDPPGMMLNLGDRKIHLLSPSQLHRGMDKGSGNCYGSLGLMGLFSLGGHCPLGPSMLHLKSFLTFGWRGQLSQKFQLVGIYPKETIIKIHQTRGCSLEYCLK